MELQKARYVNPFTDFGFKKLFGEEYNSDLLIDFLNQLLKKEQGKIKKITYLKSERLGGCATDRKAVYDLYCENENGEKFIVEMQKSKQKFFKDRSLYYASFPISQQAKTGDWNFELKAVYAIAILDFVFDEDLKEPEKLRYDVKLSDIETNEVFYDKLTFIYLQMPKFDKTIDELKDRFEKWLYVLKNLERLHNIPDKFKDRIFKKLFKAAEIARFSPEEAEQYEDSLKIYRDLKNSLDTAREEGREEGIKEGDQLRCEKIALKMIAKGKTFEEISEITELSIQQIEQLAEKNKVSEPGGKYKSKRKPAKPRKK
jgi:predicted transposase/invertase (TIGR01784 family)